MDLEQFRRAYMHMEGVTNTPGNFVKRSSRLVESVVNIPGAIKRDVDESKMNAKIKKDILNDIRENGGKNFDAETFSDLVKSGAARPSHTGAAMEQLGHSAAAMGKSANELMQTSATIVGGKRSDMYDGQDLEKGIGFAIDAEQAIRKPLRLSNKALKNAINIGMMTGATIRAFRDHDMKEKVKDITKTKTKDMEMPDIGGEDR